MCAMGQDAPAPYPLHLEREIVLRDGARLRLRPIRPDDEPRLSSLYDRLSRFTAYQRFFTAMNRLPPDWAHFLANVDYRRRLALVVEHPPDGELIAVGRYEATDRTDTAEIAFVILDGWQNRGLGAMLLGDLLATAEARGIMRFIAYVLADNTRMISLLERFTTVLERKTESGVISFLCVRRSAGGQSSLGGPVTC
jgi:RimJ/RimL family protein N-acetyltransferase